MANVSDIPIIQGQRGLTVRYPASMAIHNGKIMYSDSHVLGVQGYKDDQVHFCLLLNPHPGGHMKKEEPNPSKYQVVELLFSSHNENRVPMSSPNFKFTGDPTDIDGFAFLVATSSKQQPKEQPSMKASLSEKDISLQGSKDANAAFLNDEGYGLNVTEDGDILLVGKKSSFSVTDKTTMDAPISTNQLRGNIQTTENFINKQMMIPDTTETFPSAHDPTLNLVEIVGTANTVANWIMMSTQVYKLYQEFQELSE